MAALLSGFIALFTPKLLLLTFVGVAIGIIFGAIPGLSATMAICLFLPMTFGMNVNEAFVTMVALYIGGVSGGLISAILINIPGSAMSIATCYDGNPMATSGHAQRALGIGVVFSCLGTLFSVVIMIFAAPSLASVAVKLGPFEYFALTFFALVLVASVGSKDVFGGLASAFLGLAFCMVGMAPVDGAIRYDFGVTSLLQGIPLTSAAVGMFATTEILLNVVKPILPNELTQRKREKIKGFGFSIAELFGQTKNFLMSSVIGLFIGFLPGMGGSLANQVAYVAVQKSSKTPEKFGTGIMDGIVASETSNNASIGGAMIPLLALGIPGDGPTAMLLSAFTIHGLVSGPLLFKTSGNLVNLIFAAMLVSSVVMIVIEYFGIPVFSKIIEVPREMLYPIVLVICAVAAFANNRSMFDVWCLLAFGIFGFLMAKFNLPRTPFIMGFVLGNQIETNLRRALQLSRGSFGPFFTHPFSCVFLLLSFILIVNTIIRQVKAHKQIKTAV
ncbi:tripartite tricarboxylate transporter permease [Oscillibacter sp.]|uniref:tripartite tricarboxylate transporter permease n=1 Tax=Oscillibacter sp. TaxID=1945593 RepID=UPI0028AA1432|nr:tripartite tricarboxylate transporter permease [Oscillibacter sp.]